MRKNSVPSGCCQDKFWPSHYLQLGTKKRTWQFLRALHVYSIDNFVTFWLKFLYFFLQNHEIESNSQNWGLKQNHEIAGITNCEIRKCEDPLYLNSQDLRLISALKSKIWKGSKVCHLATQSHVCMIFNWLNLIIRIALWHLSCTVYYALRFKFDFVAKKLGVGGEQFE